MAVYEQVTDFPNPTSPRFNDPFKFQKNVFEVMVSEIGLPYFAEFQFEIYLKRVLVCLEGSWLD